MQKTILSFIFIISTFFLIQCNNPDSKETDSKQTKDSTMVSEDSVNITEASIKSEITCPECGHKKMEEMPTDVCLLTYTCEKCSAILHPKKGDCCVFCTYGTHKCPSIQEGS